MQQNLSEILDNILGLLLLEGSYDITEDENAFNVAVDTKDAGRLIGARGESLEGLQLLVSQILARKLQLKEESTEFKRIIIDVMGWRKQKEDDLVARAKSWVQQVKESNTEMALEPMPAWQRRVVHMIVQESDGVESESVDEGFNRHLVIRPAGQKSQEFTETSEPQESSDTAA